MKKSVCKCNVNACEVNFFHDVSYFCYSFNINKSNEVYENNTKFTIVC